MKDWKGIAQASGCDIPPLEFDRVRQPLEILEDELRPLLRDLAPELEPAIGLCLEGEAE